MLKHLMSHRLKLSKSVNLCLVGTCVYIVASCILFPSFGSFQAPSFEIFLILNLYRTNSESLQFLLGGVTCNGVQPCITDCQMCPSADGPSYNCKDMRAVFVTCGEYNAGV